MTWLFSEAMMRECESLRCSQDLEAASSGGHLLGWRTVCAVERDAHAAQVLAQRQNDGILKPFPIWSDIETFNGKPWRGIVNVVSGGFPCQDISSAGAGAGITGSRSGLWKEQKRIISEVDPELAWMENSPMLTIRGLGVVLGDLAEMGFDAEWGVLSARDVGAIHLRERIWILASNNRKKRIQRGLKSKIFRQSGVSWSKNVRGLQDLRNRSDIPEPLICRKNNGVPDYVDRISEIGNAQFPGVAATAFTLLRERLNR